MRVDPGPYSRVVEDVAKQAFRALEEAEGDERSVGRKRRTSASLSPRRSS